MQNPKKKKNCLPKNLKYVKFSKKKHHILMYKHVSTLLLINPSATTLEVTFRLLPYFKWLLNNVIFTSQIYNIKITINTYAFHNIHKQFFFFLVFFFLNFPPPFSV